MIRYRRAQSCRLPVDLRKRKRHHARTFALASVLDYYSCAVAAGVKVSAPFFLFFRVTFVMELIRALSINSVLSPKFRILVACVI